MRPPEPDILIKWRAMRSTPPKCCHTCDNYDKEGKCVYHWANPPIEFANAIDACPDWREECPF